MTPEENDLLCRVTGSAPMGQIMRRHWIAACLSEEVAEPDGTPLRVRLLGENLVVFRDTKGRLGVLDEYCSHRRASLAYARNEECGLRCLYHGWKFDVDGNVVEMASEPPGSSIPERVKHKAYPAREAGGFVWCYMGPADEMPEFEAPAFAPTPDARVSATKVRVRCNWAQILEGQIDSAHSSSLHSSDMVPAQVDGAKATEANWLRPSTDKAPRFQIERTSLRLPLRGDPPPDPERGDARLYPYHRLHRAFHGADSAEQRAQRRDAADARGRREHDLLFHRLEWGRQARHRCRHLAQVQRAAMGRRRRCEFQRHPHAREQLSARIAPR